MLTVGICADPVRLRNAAPRDCGRSARHWSSKPAKRVRLPPVAPRRAALASEVRCKRAAVRCESEARLHASAEGAGVRLLSELAKVRVLPGAPRRVRLQVRSLGSQPGQTGAVPVRGATTHVSAGGSGGFATNEARGGSTPPGDTAPLPRDFGGDAPNVACRGSTPRGGSPFWDRLTVGREPLDLAIVVRLHGPEPRHAPSEHSW